MVARQAVAIVSLLAFSPALAEDLDAEAARQFIVGKLFAFTCADGTRGAARIYDDGSVIGTVQFYGSEQPRPIWLPSETLKFTGATVCGSLNRRELCFALSKTSDQSFRASITGLDFAYCDFAERVRTPEAVPRLAVFRAAVAFIDLVEGWVQQPAPSTRGVSRQPTVSRLAAPHR